jgi:hypothetical protein
MCFGFNIQKLYGSRHARNNSWVTLLSLRSRCQAVYVSSQFVISLSKLGRTVPSFRIVVSEEKQGWAPFKKALDKSETKIFDEMWDIPRLYVSACSNSVQLVPFQPIAISILFHHYKELKECISEVERIEEEPTSSRDTDSNSGKEEWLTIKEEEKLELHMAGI